MKKFLIPLILISSLALAGNDTGGGGIGLQEGNRIYLYDFVEAGIEEDVYINSTSTDEMGASEIIYLKLRTNNEVIQGVTAKLNEVYRLSPTFANLLLTRLKTYQWRFVKPQLIPTRDIGRSPIRTNFHEKQIAFRDDKELTVTIDKELLSKMPIPHQVGLYFHELLYSISSDYDSYRSRILTSFLFHPQFQTATFEEFKLRVDMTLPNLELLDYETYKLINSQNYQTQCEQVKMNVKKFNVESYQFLKKFYGDFIDNFNRADVLKKSPTTSLTKRLPPTVKCSSEDLRSLSEFFYYFPANDAIFFPGSTYDDFLKDNKSGHCFVLNIHQSNYNRILHSMNSEYAIKLSQYREKAKSTLAGLGNKKYCLDSIDTNYLIKLSNTFAIDN